MARHVIEQTYNVTLPAFLDATKRIITFNFINYYIPAGEGDRINILYSELNSAISNKDLTRLKAVLGELTPFKTNVKVTPSKKQTVIKKIKEL
jgi:hypothetical protein